MTTQITDDKFQIVEDRLTTLEKHLASILMPIGPFEPIRSPIDYTNPALTDEAVQVALSKVSLIAESMPNTVSGQLAKTLAKQLTILVFQIYNRLHRLEAKAFPTISDYK